MRPRAGGVRGSCRIRPGVDPASLPPQPANDRGRPSLVAASTGCADRGRGQADPARRRHRSGSATARWRVASLRSPEATQHAAAPPSRAGDQLPSCRFSNRCRSPVPHGRRQNGATQEGSASASSRFRPEETQVAPSEARPDRRCGRPALHGRSARPVATDQALEKTHRRHPNAATIGSPNSGALPQPHVTQRPSARVRPQRYPARAVPSAAPQRTSRG
jgi:hypothetical protein